MTAPDMKRRSFLQTAAAGTAGITLAGSTAIPSIAASTTEKPALLGGTPVRTEPFPSWPMIEENDEKAWMEVLRQKGWCRTQGDNAPKFEKAFAELMGAKEAIATANGTSALFGSLNGLGIGPGDEVLVPPYTFIATVNVVLLQHAIPVFVDTDRETFQMDARKIEEKITENTRCMIPVHLGGNVADLDAILAIASKHKIPVIEDACQAHLAEWHGKKVGNYGVSGCFSFQVTKNLSGGEGGAIISDDSDLMERCYTFHTNGRSRRSSGYKFQYVSHGSNLRMTEFQAALLMQQMTRLEQQTCTREQNAAYLTSQLKEIPGIQP
ncbi:MAG: aminotransferase class I/II-fold pyridoxal phosphate-dependent enzyme, partial [bacterium]